MRADVDKAMFVEEKQTSLPEMKSTTSKCLALKQTADKEAFQLDKIITKKKSGFRKNSHCSGTFVYRSLSIFFKFAFFLE